MNGQTGKFVGNLPVDKGIFTKWFLGLTAGFSVAAYAIAWLIHTFCFQVVERSHTGKRA